MITRPELSDCGREIRQQFSKLYHASLNLVDRTMSKTYKQGKYSLPREYWFRRYKGCCGWGSYFKRLTHRFERRISKYIAKDCE